MMWSSMFSRLIFKQLQWIIPVTERSSSEQCEGVLKCAAGKPEFFLEYNECVQCFYQLIGDLFPLYK